MRHTCLSISWFFFALLQPTLAEVNQRYLFIGHPREDLPGETVQQDVERVDYSKYDLLLLGGDYTWRSTKNQETVDYIEEIFTLSSPNTLAALGNHDIHKKSLFIDKTGRGKSYYSHEKNDITFVVLDTTSNAHNLRGGQITILEDTIDNLSTSSHLVLIHHHFIWLADYPPLAHHLGSGLIGSSSRNLTGLNFHSEIYPLLLQARSKGVEVICLAGDRTGNSTDEFFIDHTTADGVRFIGAGLSEELPSSLRTVVVLEHDTSARTLTPVFKHLSDLERIPDETLVINEIHYAPSASQGNAAAFIELTNHGPSHYDLSNATFTSGIDFSFPEQTTVAPGERLLIAASADHYSGSDLRVFEYQGDDLPRQNEAIRLRNNLGRLIDDVPYKSSSPWPDVGNESGVSLALINPISDNAFAESWALSDFPGGTPGYRNFTAPTLIHTQNAHPSVTFTWQGLIPEASYLREYSYSLEPNSWRSDSDPVVGTALPYQLEVTMEAEQPKKFYRLRRNFSRNGDLPQTP